MDHVRRQFTHARPTGFEETGKAPQSGFKFYIHKFAVSHMTTGFVSWSTTTESFQMIGKAADNNWIVVLAQETFLLG